MTSRDALIAPHVQAFFALSRRRQGRNPRPCLSPTSTRPSSCNFSTISNTNAAMPSAHGTCVWRRSAPLRASSPCATLSIEPS